MVNQDPKATNTIDTDTPQWLIIGFKKNKENAIIDYKLPILYLSNFIKQY